MKAPPQSLLQDSSGSLTYAKELIEYIHFLIEQKEKGIFHFSSTGASSRYDIAKKLVSYMKLKVHIQPVTSEFFADRFFAPRPKSEVLGSVKLPEHFAFPWRQSLKRYVDEELTQH